MEKWKYVVGAAAGIVIFGIMEAIDYAWDKTDPDAQNCYKNGFNEGRYFLNLFVNSGGEMGNSDFLRPTNDQNLFNDCQRAFQAGYAHGVTYLAAKATVSAFAGGVTAKMLTSGSGTRQGGAFA